MAGRPAAPVHPAPALPAARRTQPYSPEWVRVFSAMDGLRLSLESHQILTSYPDIAHDLMVLLAAFEGARGDALFDEYWRAQLERLVSLTPNIKKLPSPPATRPTGSSIYAYQSLNTVPGGD